MTGEKKATYPTEEGRLVIAITKSLFIGDVDETLRLLGRHMDKHRIQVSKEVLQEYEFAGRIREP